MLHLGACGSRTASPLPPLNFMIYEHADPLEIFGFQIGAFVTEHTHEVIE